jgi:SAM-dependent methyltransferase
MEMRSPIDFSRADEARAWAEAANLKRPWRADFFAAIVQELRALDQASLSILELGSGPGFLAEAVLREWPDARYTLLDASQPMHDLARQRLGPVAGVRFVTADFTNDNWWEGLGSLDAVLTMQAVHELRHRTRAVDLHRDVHRLLRSGGPYLVCDHVLGPEGMSNSELHLTASEQKDALARAGFTDVAVVLEKGGLVLHRGRASADERIAMRETRWSRQPTDATGRV